MSERFDKVVEVMATLRAEQGCPWDRKQTHESLKPYLLEETYEVLETIDQQDPRKLQEELGDVLLQYCSIARLRLSPKPLPSRMCWKRSPPS